jgi:GNAT superfamily N-acetyltransferase
VPSDDRLRRLLEPTGGLTVLALDAGDEVVAMASLLTEGDLGEVALLVRDDWQRKGVGTALLRRLVAFAERTGCAAVAAHTAGDNVAMLRTLRRIGAGDSEHDGQIVTVTLAVAGKLPAADETPATSG